jgi:hypothetical protein
MRYAARTDATQQAIVGALRAVGCGVQLLFRVGAGCPDVLAWSPFTRSLHLLEIKSGPREPLTRDEADWHAAWPGPVEVVWSVEDALAAIGAVELTHNGLT